MGEVVEAAHAQGSWSSPHLRSILDQLGDAVVVVDRDFRFVFANSAALRLVNRTLDEILGMTHWELVPQLKDHPVGDAYRKAMLTGEQSVIEYVSPLSGRWMHSKFFPSSEGMVFHLTDITPAKVSDQERVAREEERTALERDLRQSESRLRRIIDAATVGVIVNDRRGRFTHANDPLLKMLGYTKADLDNGRLSWRLIQAPDRLDADDHALDQLRESGSCLPYETEFVASDGHRIPVYVGAAFIPDESGEGLLGAAFVTDLTLLKGVQQELERLNTDLEERVRERTAELQTANRALETYSHHVAHDLRSPLRAIAATSRMLEEDFGQILPEAALEMLHRQDAAARKLGHLIDDLLKISRLSREDMGKEPTDLSELCRSAAREAIACHPNTLVTIEVQEGMRANVDPRLIRLALLNLIENAVKYSPLGGVVKVGRSPDGTFVVRDEGIGFDVAYSQKIFEPFQRLHRDDSFSGTGVGLSNVRQVIERHGGAVWVDSEPGYGSSFFFTLE